jgi:hypothetical protein
VGWGTGPKKSKIKRKIRIRKRIKSRRKAAAPTASCS